MPRDGRRSTKELRSSLDENRHRLEDDLDELEDRFDESLSPRHLFARHPVLVSVAGALVGALVVRRPALVARSVARLAQLGAPLLLRTLLKRDRPARSSSEAEAPVADD